MKRDIAGYAALSAFLSVSTAVSSDALAVSKAAAVVAESAEGSQVLSGGRNEALSRLWSLANECSMADWDGNGSLGVDCTAVNRAAAILRVLPGGIAFPEFSAEPDGAISLDWIQSPRRLFSLSTGRTDRLAFAWLDGTDQGHGVARFDGRVIPKRILQGILGVLNHEGSPIWPA